MVPCIHLIKLSFCSFGLYHSKPSMNGTSKSFLIRTPGAHLSKTPYAPLECKIGPWRPWLRSRNSKAANFVFLLFFSFLSFQRLDSSDHDDYLLKISFVAQTIFRDLRRVLFMAKAEGSIVLESIDSRFPKFCGRA